MSLGCAARRNPRKLGVLLALLPGACGGTSGSGENVETAGPGAEPWFREVAQEWGLDFVHKVGPMRYDLPEIMGGGVALLDYDGDGRLDIYLVQGGDLAGGDTIAPDRLYKNMGERRFEDVTERAGLGDREYGMGAAVGDYDADGDPDLYVTNVGQDHLYRNEGDGTFQDVTVPAGIVDGGWGTSAAFLDYDADGSLDLFVAHYVRWSSETAKPCYVTSRNLERDYCPPKASGAPMPSVLYRGRGDGTFEDVSERVGLWTAFGNGLGVCWGDFDSDGRLDVYVSNDDTPKNLWLQVEPGRFEDHALQLGCAVGAGGETQAGMGVQALDYDTDGDLDIFLAHLRGEVNTVYLQEKGRFRESTARVGLAAASRLFTSFGLGLLDFDCDGILDYYITNGAVLKEYPLIDPAKPFAQPNQLFRGLPDGRFEEFLPRGGTLPELVENSRGTAFGDLDDDGDIDIVIVDEDAPVHVLENVVGARSGWIQFRVLDGNGSDALGATVRIRAGDRAQVRGIQPAYSYQASNDPRAHFGLGAAERADEVVVRWTDGSEESFGPLAARAIHVLRRGEGR